MYTESPQQQQTRQQNFQYHRPHTDQPERYERLRSAGGDLSLLLNTNCPPSRELALAQTHLEQAIFWANAAIARNEKPGPAPVAEDQPVT